MSRSAEGVPVVSVLLAMLLFIFFILQLQGSFHMDSVALQVFDDHVSGFEFFLLAHVSWPHMLFSVGFLLGVGWYLERFYHPYMLLGLLATGALVSTALWLTLGDHGRNLIGPVGPITTVIVFQFLCSMKKNRDVALPAAWFPLQIGMNAFGEYTTAPWTVLIGASLVACGARLFLPLLASFEKKQDEENRGDKWHKIIIEANKMEKEKSPSIGSSASPAGIVSSAVEQSSEQNKTVQGEVDPNEPMDHMAAANLENRIRGVLLHNPEKIGARSQLVNLYIRQGKRQEAIRQGCILIQQYCERGGTGGVEQANHFYTRLTSQFGNFQLEAKWLKLLCRDRLQAKDIMSAISMIESILAMDKTLSALPDFMTMLVRLLIIKHGYNSNVTKSWFNRLVEEYPFHPRTLSLRKEIQQKAPNVTFYQADDEDAADNSKTGQMRIVDDRVKKMMDL